MCLMNVCLLHIYVLSHIHWSMDSSSVHCSMLCQTFFFKMKDVISATNKFCSNVVMTPVIKEAKINK